MVYIGEDQCPICGEKLRYYDRVNRSVRTKNGIKSKTIIRRLKCQGCKTIHRELPDFIFPYKHYDADIIRGVVEGLITYETIGYEDYPCEVTMLRWIREFSPTLF